MRLVFMGTPEFAVPSLLSLYERGHEIAGVFTRPDKSRGRGMKESETPVAISAKELGIPVYKPVGFKDKTAYDILRSLEPDIIVVVAYGRILPEIVLTLPKYGCINAHASILPKYRGAAPIQWAIIRGETTTGISIMQMSAGLDEGDVLLVRETDISIDENAGQLHDRLKALAAEILPSALELIESGSITPSPQQHENATFAPIIRKEDGRIDFTRSPTEINNFVRGMYPWPVASTTLNDSVIRILSVLPLDIITDKQPGLLIEASRRLIVACTGGSIEILRLQLPGGKPLSAQEFLRGHKLSPETESGVF